MILCISERKTSGACVADPFARAKGAWKRLDTFTVPRRGASGGLYLPAENMCHWSGVCQSWTQRSRANCKSPDRVICVGLAFYVQFPVEIAPRERTWHRRPVTSSMNAHGDVREIGKSSLSAVPIRRRSHILGLQRLIVYHFIALQRTSIAHLRRPWRAKLPPFKIKLRTRGLGSAPFCALSGEAKLRQADIG